MSDPILNPDTETVDLRTPDPERELAEEISQDLFTMGGSGEAADRLVLTQDDPERKLGGWCRRAVVDRIEAHLRVFLADSEAPHPAHVIEKIRHGGDRHGERVFYAVGPVRGSLAEAHDDEAKMVETVVSRREEELEGQLAALRGALEDLIGLAESAMREANRGGGEYDVEVELVDARVALASGAGEREAEFLRAALDFHDSTDPMDGTEARFHDAADALREARGGKEGS